MSNKGGEFIGNIITVRAVEDSIRATKKYTVGISRKQADHPIQGEDFPSRMFYLFYEVYPDIELNWDMPASIALDWLWGETPCIDVRFSYDYRTDKAAVIVYDGQEAVKDLARTIPGFSDALLAVIANGEKPR